MTMARRLKKMPEFKVGDMIVEIGKERKVMVVDVRELTYHLWWFGGGPFGQPAMGIAEVDRDFVLLERKDLNGNDIA